MMARTRKLPRALRSKPTSGTYIHPCHRRNDYRICFFTSPRAILTASRPVPRSLPVAPPSTGMEAALPCVGKVVRVLQAATVEHAPAGGRWSSRAIISVVDGDANRVDVVSLMW
jgi:hypothetical protein